MKFKDLPDNARFRVTLDMEAGMNVVYVKVVEKGTNYNAVRVDNPVQTIRIADNIDVTQI